MQEFFTAYWLAQFCDDQDVRRFGQRLYCSDRPQTESYYWVWRFVCEMPDAARNPRAWSRAIELIFRPGAGTIAGTCRSGELIYRAWPGLEELVRRGQPQACRVQAAFWGEFENEILSGRRGDQARRVAQQFRDRFLDIPAGRFQMGAPPEKQGMPAELKRQWQAYLEREGDPAELAEQYLSEVSYAPGKAGQRMRDEAIERWTRIFRDRDVEAISKRYYPSNETPRQPMQEIDAFQLNRWPTINAWYRLFNPGHGLADSWYRETYRRISPEPETPAIYVSWYDTWAFCLWARWDGLSCRLPHENEWEYAAKAGTNWRWNYWWGDDFNASKCNAKQNVGRTTRPDPAHSNPWGLLDMLGNVWEWTDDEYRRAYDLQAPPTVPPACCVAARGAASRSTCVPRAASATIPGTLRVSPVFAWPGLYSENLNLFFPFSSPILRWSSRFIVLALRDFVGVHDLCGTRPRREPVFRSQGTGIGMIGFRWSGNRAPVC